MKDKILEDVNKRFDMEHFDWNQDKETFIDFIVEDVIRSTEDTSSDYKPINKNFPSARCQQCGEVTDIQFSWCYRQLVVKIKTFREMLKSANESQRRWLNIKNGQIQAMHKIIAKLIGLLTPEQKVEAKKLTQEMRDLIKKAEKKK